MKLVFLNMNTRKLEVYDKSGMKNLPFSGLNNIKNTLGKEEEVLYITNATKVSVSKIVNAIAALNKQTIDSAIQENKELYLRSTNKGTIIIDDLKLVFAGPTDFKPLKQVFAKFGKDILEEHPVIRKLMERGQLEILTKNEAKSNYTQLLEEEKEKKIAAEKRINKAKKDEEPGYDIWSGKNPLNEISAIGGKTSASNNEGSLLPEFSGE